ncbi:MAG: MATE family efflux transporter [Cellulosilyticaceae bacterium]
MSHTTSKMQRMESTPMLRLLMSMSLPAMFSMLVQSMYNIVDSIFVSQIGEQALTAVSLVFPIQTMILAVAVGTGIGLNSLISRSLGEKNHEKAGRIADHGIILALVSWLMFALVGVVFSESFFEFFTNDQIVIDMGRQYMFIVTLFSIGCFVQINIEKIFQATGNMIYPMIMQIVGAVTNIILDPILIFGLFGLPEMGIAGAAIATVIGQLLAMVVSIYLMAKKSKVIKISFKEFKIETSIIKEIYKVGFPSILMQSIMAFLVIILNNILIVFSQTAVSILGIYFKLQSFIYMPVFGLTQGALPIMGYSYGAKNKTRLISCLKNALVIAIAIMVGGVVLFNGLPEQLLKMFNATDQMMGIGIPALRIVSIGFVFAGVGIVISTLFQAIGEGMNSLVISIIRQIIILLPLAWILSKMLGVTGVWIAFPVAEIMGAIASIILLIRSYKKKIKKIE